MFLQDLRLGVLVGSVEAFGQRYPPFFKRWHLGMVTTDYEYDEQHSRHMWAMEYGCMSR